MGLSAGFFAASPVAAGGGVNELEAAGAVVGDAFFTAGVAGFDGSLPAAPAGGAAAIGAPAGDFGLAAEFGAAPAAPPGCAMALAPGLAPVFAGFGGTFGSRPARMSTARAEVI